VNPSFVLPELTRGGGRVVGGLTLNGAPRPLQRGLPRENVTCRNKPARLYERVGFSTLNE